MPGKVNTEALKWAQVRAQATFTPAVQATTPLTYKFKPGAMMYLDNRRATRALIIALPQPGSVRYTCLLEFGSVGWYGENALMTLAGWLTWWERFRDEIIPKEWRECAENARREFVPPPGWDEAVKRATEANSSNVKPSGA